MRSGLTDGTGESAAADALASNTEGLAALIAEVYGKGRRRRVPSPLDYPYRCLRRLREGYGGGHQAGRDRR